MPLFPVASVLGLSAAFAWGCADFCGGLAAKRLPALASTCVTHATALAIALSLALATHAVVPPMPAILWGFAAGASGATALALFYHILSQGHMGLKTAISALVGAAIPALFDVAIEGWPHPVQAAGFALAALAIVLFTWEDGGIVWDRGMALAAVCGVAFAGFFLFTRQAGPVSPFWLASCTRAAALALLGPALLIVRPKLPRQAEGSLIATAPEPRTAQIKRGLAIALLCGVCDVGGTLLYIFSTRYGRMDVAVILSSLYPGITVILAWLVLRESFTRQRAWAMLAALAAVPLIASG